ncbi:hypothetical protein CHCC14820_3562 [Bacillus paralicheniformis]|jgi:hypothetical protein|uniref:Uncharacterized protein n=1 Tax=Bacillus paralicheniformis TaxID=1648923 RepID=A0A6I7TLL3_9BACI|nr:hypothetical protein SC10_B2orf04356 [Bacillus paralicheniformis]OLF91329.1 hypothetical protein B4121_2807 [Bacillus paralicheniformis]TWJ42410.1 hypothetical protein CHCC5027_4230 [Bacillus paralicheniformis]TWJ52256.1 hypothetical protein CHCC5023_4377 [Bacillus paralicheniformis]TWJ66285.1 hypothetical protein CHCC5021_0561 [Bacillus paralicheniformis]
MPGQQGTAASKRGITPNDRFSKINEGFMIGSPHLFFTNVN